MVVWLVVKLGISLHSHCLAFMEKTNERIDQYFREIETMTTIYKWDIGTKLAFALHGIKA